MTRKGTGISNQGVLWASVWASAAVAAFTTLLIEYLAKPWLEVRKERILEKDRRTRNALNGLRRASFLAGRMLALRNSQADELLRARTMKAAAELEPLVAAAVEDLDVPDKLGGHWITATSVLVAVAIMIEEGELSKKVWDDFDIASEKAGLYEDLVSTPRWRWWRRLKIVRKVRALPSIKTTPPDEEPPEVAEEEPVPVREPRA